MAQWRSRVSFAKPDAESAWERPLRGRSHLRVLLVRLLIVAEALKHLEGVRRRGVLHEVVHSALQIRRWSR